MTDNTGLIRKFRVERTDPEAQRRHLDCHHFVLDIDHDPHALPALMAYAKSATAEHPVLAAELRDIVHWGGWRPHVDSPTTPPEPCCDSTDHVTENGWLCEVHPHHTCGSTQPHEPGCGLVPIMNMTELDDWTPEPVVITPESPEWRSGAKVRGEFADDFGAIEGTLRSDRIYYGGPDKDMEYFWGPEHFTRVLLLAEAVDPDADARRALEVSLGLNVSGVVPESVSTGILASIRGNGFDLTRADS